MIKYENECADCPQGCANCWRKRPDRTEALTVHTEPGDNKKYIDHSLRLAGLPQIDIKSADELKQRATEYFTICAEDDMKPSVAGLAVAIGVRKTLWEWSVTGNSDRSNVIKKAYACWICR